MREKERERMREREKERERERDNRVIEKYTMVKKEFKQS